MTRNAGFAIRTSGLPRHASRFLAIAILATSLTAAAADSTGSTAHRASGASNEVTRASELLESGHDRAAVRQFEQLLAERARRHGASAAQTREVREALANALLAQGHTRRAELLLGYNLDAVTRTLGAAHPQTLRTLVDLAAAHAARGDIDAAEQLLQRATTSYRERGEATSAKALAVLVRLAALDITRGEFAAAALELEQVVDTGEAQRTDANDEFAAILRQAREELAHVRFEQERYEEARRLVQSVIDDRASADTDASAQATRLAAQTTLAHLLVHDKRYDEAMALQQHLLEVRRSRHDDHHPDVLAVHADLAETAFAAGDHDGALQRLTRTTAATEATLGELHPRSLQLRLHLAQLQLIAGRMEATLQTLRILEPRLRGRRSHRARASARATGIRPPGRLDATFVDLALALARHAPALASRYAADVVVRTKHLAADMDAIAEHAARTTRDPALLAIAARVHSGRARLARAAHAATTPDPTLEAEIERLGDDEAALARASVEFSRARDHAANANALLVARALPPGAVVLEVQRYRDVLEPLEHGRDRYALVWIGSDTTVEVHDLGAVETSRDAVRDIADLDTLIADDDSATARRLYSALFGALDDRLSSHSRVYLAPDGALHGVPFHALVLPDGRYWIERHDLRLVGSARDLLTPDRPHDGDRLLAVGGVDYGQPGSIDPRSNGTTFVPLPGSRREVDALQSQWQALALPVTVWTDAAADEAAFEALAQPPDYLHLATHGFFVMGPEVAHLPLAASGVALAGANREADGTGHGDDGILFAEEALDLPLAGTELVVLSACDTARGVDANGEGNLGLVRALRTAGARQVISALWQISDTQTVPFMQAFYARLLADPNRDAPAALRATQLEWIRSTVDGRAFTENWAAFVLVARR